MARRVGRQGASIVVAAVIGLGCAGTHQRPTGADAGATAGAAGGHDGGSPAGTGGSATDGPGRVIGGDALGEMACASATQKAQQVPLDLYFMIDSSGSMADTTANGQTKWAAVVGAMRAFLEDPQSAGLGVGVQYFPLVNASVPDSCNANGDCGSSGGACAVITTCSQPTSGTVTPCASNADCRGQGTCVRLGACGPANAPLACAPPGPGSVCTNGYTCTALAGYCNGRDKCDVASYATPAVEVAPLPGVAAAIEASLGQHMPDGLTPTSAALSGAISHAQALAAANPTHKVVVVLATDGEPDECTPSDIAGVAAIASAGRAGTPAISTYVIGVFAPAEAADAQTNLSTLAAAGGTGQAFIINTSQNVSQAFVSALNSVRSSGLACQYTVPTPSTDAGHLDYFSVNVEYTSGSNQTVTIGNVKDRASCSPTQGGWYYDVDPSTGARPQTISICDTTCNELQSDPAGRVDILLGCQTVFIVD